MESSDNSAEQLKRTDLAGLSVLIAEDEAIVAMGLVDVVEEAGGEVIGPFATVSACLECIKTQNPDLAILDLRLEDGESLCVASELVEKAVPVVFHSGHMANQEWQAHDGTVLYCAKPCPTSEMTETLLAAASQR